MSSHAQPLVPARSAVSLAWPAALALAALMGIGRFAFTPVWPLMAHDAALSLEQGGWLASANYAGYLLGALIAAAWPPRRPLGASLLAVAALTLAMPLPHSVAGWAALRLAAGWASALGFICVASWRPARAGDPIEPAASAVVYAGVGAGIAATGLACLALMAAGATAAQCWVALGAGAGLVDGRLAQTARGAAGHRRVRPPIQPGTAAARHGGTGVALRRVRHRLHHSRHLPARHGQGSHARSGGVRLGLAPVRTGRRAVLPDGACWRAGTARSGSGAARRRRWRWAWRWRRCGTTWPP